MTGRYLETGAAISPCGGYRYSLWRRLAPGRRTVLFVGLNPSTADGTQDDRTIRREVDYAQRWGFDLYVKVNVYAYRSTDPDVLPSIADPVGPENWAHVLANASRADLILCAWGSNPLTAAARRIATELRQFTTAHYLKLNQDGEPSHPLYLPKILTPQPFTRTP